MLVRLELVGNNMSALRAAVVALHLANTYLLVASLAVVAWSSQGGAGCLAKIQATFWGASRSWVGGHPGHERCRGRHCPGRYLIPLPNACCRAGSRYLSGRRVSHPPAGYPPGPGNCGHRLSVDNRSVSENRRPCRKSFAHGKLARRVHCRPDSCRCGQRDFVSAAVDAGRPPHPGQFRLAGAGAPYDRACLFEGLTLPAYGLISPR